MEIAIRRFLFTILFLFPLQLFSQTNTDSFIRGVDISFTPQIEDAGGKYKLNGVEKDVLDIFKENGANYVRLRLWHTPSNGYCGLTKTLAYAKRVKAKGFKFLLDFHYSDWWADPGKQNKPAAWANASYAALKESVYTYTKYVIEALKNQNTLPDMVQIGNEITGGMLWPDGKLYNVANPDSQWIKFAELVKQGIAGVKDAQDTGHVKIMIHIDRGGDNNGSVFFYDHLIAQGANFDVIGLSYYPWWHGTLAQMKNNVNDLAVRYGKPIVIAETAYPWTTQSLNDGQNITVDATKLPKGYSISPQGQKAFLAQLTKILKEANNNKGIGFFYWEPAYISVSPVGSSWEHLTTFDFTGNALTSITAFMNLDTMKTVNVKVRVNTSTMWDTLKSNGIVQVRGEIKGLGSYLLPNGELVTWDSYSQIVPKNIGGDYWEYQFTMYQSDQLEYKFWTGHTASTPTKVRLGYEGPVSPYDGSNRNIRLFVAGASDTTLDFQFYNSWGDFVDQYWSPIHHKVDSIGVLFRVSAADLMQGNVFDPTIHGPIVVRGDSSSSAGILSWSSNTEALAQETLSVVNGSFWSGVLYFPKGVIPAGTQIKYKFYIVNSSFGGWESAIDDRSFSFPAEDTTLAWRFFNERNSVTGVSSNPETLPKEFRLYQNYPNPFNPETVISFQLSTVSHVDLTVFDLLGRKVATLVNGEKGPGASQMRWDGKDEKGHDVRSGLYFYRLTIPVFTQTKKMLLVR